MAVDPNTLDALKMALNSDAAKALTLPVAHEVGQLMGDVANIVRFYTTDTLGKVFTRWYEQRVAEGRILTAGDIAKTIPLLQAAAMARDEDLQGRWVNLLESVATDDLNYMPSFASTLSVLTSEEVKFLDKLYDIGMKPPEYSPYPPGILPMNDESLIRAFDPSINPGVKAVQMKLYGSRMSAEEHTNYKRLLHCRMVIEDLVGLKIIAVTERYALVEDRVNGGKDVGKSINYALSHYGVSFIRAVSPKARLEI